MSSSLDRLATTFRNIHLTHKLSLRNKNFKLMKQKGVHPYDYMDIFQQVLRKFPEKIYFYSILQDGHISDEQYKHAENMWNSFNLSTMCEYLDLHLKSHIHPLGRKEFQDFQVCESKFDLNYLLHKLFPLQGIFPSFRCLSNSKYLTDDDTEFFKISSLKAKKRNEKIVSRLFSIYSVCDFC